MTIGIQTRRTMLLAAVWIFAALFLTGSSYSFMDTSGALFMMALIFALPTALTYFTLVRTARTAEERTLEKPKLSRKQRVQSWLESLDDDELDALRDRLSDTQRQDEYSLEELLSKPKRR